MTRSIFASLTLALLVSVPAPAMELMPAGSYDVTTAIGMPHLDENLRYATVRERRCWNNLALAAAFPILGHESLRGCRLSNERRQDDVVLYALMCDGGQGTTGNAQWHLGGNRISGTLEVKLGGKNMTFHQRITATRVGECPFGADGSL